MRTPRHSRAGAIAFLVHEVEDRTNLAMQLDIEAIQQWCDFDAVDHRLDQVCVLGLGFWVTEFVFSTDC
ncbi:MAG: hypothetical protein ABJX32_11525 [Tateyamaria sp.]|uniref:hypothetical protein n=1 Tax=Tateyamaria sp. TaxID=1929288 RepID=UPI00329B4DDD